MNYKIIFMAVLVSFSSTAYSAEINNEISIKLQMKNSNFLGTPHSLSLPVCLSVDLRQSIPITSLMRTTGDSNPSPLPGIKYEKCQAGNARQAFNFDGNKLISSQGTCLTRVEQSLQLVDMLKEQRKCSSTDGVTLGDSWTINLTTNVKLQTCDDNNQNQMWNLEIVDDYFQLKADNNRCLSMQGARVSGQSFYGGSQTIWAGCPVTWYNSFGTLVRDTNTDSMGLGLDSCASATTEFQSGGESVIVIEKLMPIIIPL